MEFPGIISKGYKMPEDDTFFVMEEVGKILGVQLESVKLIEMGCIVVPGKSRDDEHAWNIVKVNGNAYHLDMTWDVANSRPGHICYDYYNLPEREITLDHSEFGGVPACILDAENICCFYTNCGTGSAEICAEADFRKSRCVLDGKLCVQ